LFLIVDEFHVLHDHVNLGLEPFLLDILRVDASWGVVKVVWGCVFVLLLESGELSEE